LPDGRTMPPWTAAYALALASLGAAGGAKPPSSQPAAVARWLMARAAWGVLTTTSAQRNHSAWGNVVSHADNCTGVPLFYLSRMDETARDLDADPRATLVISEAELFGRCLLTDPEDPTCAKLSLHGRVSEAPNAAAAREALFAKHPAMRTWPRGHKFAAFQMHTIEDVFVLTTYGGATPVPVREYLGNGAADAGCRGGTPAESVLRTAMAQAASS